ncbi:UDP-N-acetylglucosamine 2-epimerase [Virgibacillus byunsanensis]|uniref:UDP-N-acetylglucosamine 2-epimerase n=1 Tax=Virgibacillus byunsanensis TaxID=570945 RepID=A0ABW3LFN5_9BACI
MPTRKICIVTGTRADYGLLYWIMKEIELDDRLELQIIATGMHLSPEFGLTYKKIEEDGFKIDEKLEMLLSSDTPVGITKSVGLATIGFSDAFEKLKPDILVVLGDRYEILAAAQAAVIARIPIAHIHGGEATEGLIDEAIRHAVTKMSHIHFPAAEPYKNRIIQMGENPEKVYNFGAPGIENINRMQLLDRESFEKSIDFKLGKLSFLITYHPVTLHKEGPVKATQNLLTALREFKEARMIFTKPNSDTDGRIISKMIDEFALEYPDRVITVTSLGQLRYLSAIRYVDIVIGNSSSGLIEVPSFKKPTVNLGVRQQGRIKADSVIDATEEVDSIIEAINKALSNSFQSKLLNCISPYGSGDVSLNIKNTLKTIDLNHILEKKFVDG